MAAPDKDEDVTVDLATTIILKPGNVNDQSVGYASGIAGEVVNGSMTLPNGITIVAFYLTGRMDKSESFIMKEMIVLITGIRYVMLCG